MKAPREWASDSDRLWLRVRRSRQGGREMNLHRMCRERRQTAASSGLGAARFSSVSGVVLGGPHTRGNFGNEEPNRLTAGVDDVRRYGHGGVPASSADETAERLDLRLDRASQRCAADIRISNHNVNVREVPLRRTKTRRRFNPGRRRDCDLRFSFPHCSRNLPFLSHDARVEMGRSVRTTEMTQRLAPGNATAPVPI